MGWGGEVQGSDAIYLVFNFLLIFCNINFTCYKQLAPVTKDIPISVLRASILGPILFLCYINDLPGSTLLYSVQCTHFFLLTIQLVNADKIKYILFYAKNKTVNPGNSVLVFNNNEPGQSYKGDLVSPLCRIQSNHTNNNHINFLASGWIKISRMMNMEKICVVN